MALTTILVEMMDESIASHFGYTAGLRMIELGDQVCVGMQSATGKEYFTKCGFEHVSIDLNGNHGALALDLTQPELFSEFYGYFDVLTNSGTSEHVLDQAAVFEICDKVLKPGGLAIHIVPDVSARETTWKGHSPHYYDASIFEAMSQFTIQKIELLRSQDKEIVIDGLLYVAMVKK